jgi:hypothetical protein
MKQLMTTGLFFLLCTTYQCSSKEPGPDDDGITTDTAELTMYMNGEAVDYFPRIISYRNTGIITYDFVQGKGIFTNIFGIFLPVSLVSGEFGKDLIFNQYRHIDHGNQRYDLIEPENAKFTVGAIDTITKEVRGSFKAKFKRSMSAINTGDAYLPEDILFEGKFNTKYTDY